MGCGSSAQACQLTAEEAADVDTFLAGAHNAEKLQEEVAQLNEEDPKELVSHSLPAPPGPPDAGTTPHDLAKDGDDKKVFVALLSGKDCECLWLQDRTIRQLKEEAQQKLDLTIKTLIGPNMEPLDEEKMLAEENVMPGTTLTVVAVNQAAEDEKEAADCDNDILRAAKHGRLGAVRHLLRTVPGAVAAKDLDGTTALHFAAREGHAEICRVLLAAKAEVDARDFFGGATALFWAAGNVHAEICRVLLAARAEVDARDQYGHTPLHQAALTDNVESCQVLLAAGAEVDARNSNGRTALHFEAQAGCVEVVKLLLEAKASVTVKDSDGDTPLDDARRKGHDEIITMLERAA